MSRFGEIVRRLLPVHWSTVWCLYLELAVGIAVAAVLVPSALEPACILAAACASVGAIVVGVRHNRPRQTRVLLAQEYRFGRPMVATEVAELILSDAAFA